MRGHIRTNDLFLKVAPPIQKDGRAQYDTVRYSTILNFTGPDNTTLYTALLQLLYHNASLIVKNVYNKWPRRPKTAGPITTREAAVPNYTQLNSTPEN